VSRPIDVDEFVQEMLGALTDADTIIADQKRIIEERRVLPPLTRLGRWSGRQAPQWAWRPSNTPSAGGTSAAPSC
jgi:hypothetical protein